MKWQVEEFNHNFSSFNCLYDVHNMLALETIISVLQPIYAYH
mgnify:FL=1